MTAITFADHLGTDVTEGLIPDALMTNAEVARETLIEALADVDDTLAETHLDGGDITRRCSATRYAKACPSSSSPRSCGSLFKNKGAEHLLDAAAEYPSSPPDVRPAQGLEPGSDEPVERPSDVTALFAARVSSAKRPVWGAARHPPRRLRVPFAAGAAHRSTRPTTARNASDDS